MDVRSKALRQIYADLASSAEAAPFLFGYLSADLKAHQLLAAHEAWKRHTEELARLEEPVDLVVNDD